MPTAGNPVEIVEFDSATPGEFQVEHGIFVIEMLINWSASIASHLAILEGINVVFVNLFDSDCKMNGLYVIEKETIADQIFSARSAFRKEIP